MHPMLRLALLRAEDPDAVEKSCKGKWDRVVSRRGAQGAYLAVLRKDGSTKIRFPLVDDKTASKTLEKLTKREVQQPTGEGAPCPCGCGQMVVNLRGGRPKKWATEDCRRKAATQARRKREAAARASRSRQATEVDAPTPVPETPEPVAEPDVVIVVPEPEPEPVVLQRTVLCARCDEPGHFVEDCKYASRRAAMKAKNGDDARARFKGGGTAAVVREPAQVITCAKCHEPGHSMFTCSKPIPQAKVVVRAPEPVALGDEELGRNAQQLAEAWREGLPSSVGYSYLPDVLALYGQDEELVESVLRHPERVEVRPESFNKDKRYIVLGFYRGDATVILGMRNPQDPTIIATYLTARLEADTHRVGHSGSKGGGGARETTGLPKTSRQVATRLRQQGCEVEVDSRDKAVEVFYKEQSLGKIATDGDRQTCESDYQRIVRKMHAIDARQESA